jgi:hypothetical protein
MEFQQEEGLFTVRSLPRDRLLGSSVADFNWIIGGRKTSSATGSLHAYPGECESMDSRSRSENQFEVNK